MITYMYRFLNFHFLGDKNIFKKALICIFRFKKVNIACMPNSNGMLSASFPPRSNQDKGWENHFSTLGLSLVHYYFICNNSKPMTVQAHKQPRSCPFSTTTSNYTVRFSTDGHQPVNIGWKLSLSAAVDASAKSRVCKTQWSVLRLPVVI